MPGRSKIHGVGVFAATPIAEGEKLMEFGGMPITAADIDTDLYRTRSLWTVGDDSYLGLLESDPEPSLIKAGPIGLQLHSNNVPQEVRFMDLVIETFPKDQRLVTVK